MWCQNVGALLNTQKVVTAEREASPRMHGNDTSAGPICVEFLLHTRPSACRRESVFYTLEGKRGLGGHKLNTNVAQIPFNL